MRVGPPILYRMHIQLLCHRKQPDSGYSSKCQHFLKMVALFLFCFYTKFTKKASDRHLFHLQCLTLVQICPHPRCYLKTPILLALLRNLQKSPESFLPYSNHYFHFSGGKLKLEVLLKEIVSTPPNSDAAGIRSPGSTCPVRCFHQYQLQLLGWKHI